MSDNPATVQCCACRINRILLYVLWDSRFIIKINVNKSIFLNHMTHIGLTEEWISSFLNNLKIPQWQNLTLQILWLVLYEIIQYVIKRPLDYYIFIWQFSLGCCNVIGWTVCDATKWLPNNALLSAQCWTWAVGSRVPQLPTQSCHCLWPATQH